MASAINRNRIDAETYLGETSIYSVHAEDAVIRKVTEARGTVLYVARVNAAGPQLSRPCESCFELINRHEIKRVVWT